MFKYFELFFVLLLTSKVLSEGGFYTVFAPKFIRSWETYRFSVNFDDVNKPVNVQCYLKQNGTIIQQTKDLILPDESKIFQFTVKELPKAQYNLEVISQSSHLSFKTESPLTLLENSYFVFIRTDKATYKPGDQVRFQVVVLNSENFRPVTSSDATILLKDGYGNTVEKWTKQSLLNGMLTAEYQLSDELGLGYWTILVNMSHQRYQKRFLVALHIYPNFVIDIDVPKHVLFLDQKLIVGVKARHFYGMNINGNVTVAIYPTIRSGVLQPIFQNPARKLQSLVNGEVEFNFDIGRDLKLRNEYQRTVIVDVIVEESLTNQKQNKSAIVNIFKHKYKLELVKSGHYFKPGFNYKAFVRILNMDGSLVRDLDQKITIKYGFNGTSSTFKSDVYDIPNDGILELNLKTPKSINYDEEEATYLQIEAYLQDLKQWFEPIFPEYSSSGTYIQASLLSESLQVNSDAEFLVRSSENFEYINYEVFGAHGVLVSKKKRFNQPRNSTILFVEIEPAMRPLSHLVVHYVRPDGELISDSLRFEVSDFILGNLTVASQSEAYNSGDNVDFKVRGPSNALVSLLAFDNRSISDFDDVSVDDFLLNGESKELPYPKSIFDAVHVSWNSGRVNSKSSFENFGSLLLTNAVISDIKRGNDDIYNRFPAAYGSNTLKPDLGPPIAFKTGTRPPLAGPYAFSRIPKPILNEPRIYLTENLKNTWFFKNITLDYDGTASIREKLPKSSANNWRVKAMSVSTKGVNINSVTTVIAIKPKPFELFTNIPYSVKRGEVISIPVVLKNNQDRAISVDIEMLNDDENVEFIPETEPEFEVSPKKRTVSVPANSHGTVTIFIVKAVNLGETHFDIIAKESDNGLTEKITEILTVISEGITQYKNYRFAVNFDQSSTIMFDKNLTLDIPEYHVPDSVIVEISAGGDIFSSVYKNLDNLVPLLPKHGSCDLALLNIAPNVIVADHLSKLNKLSISMRDELTENLQLGLQQVLRYRLQNGAFTIFYRENELGSVWMTSVVLFWLLKARNYIYVDEDIVTNGLQWLNDQQGGDGAFFENGTVVHKTLQDSPVALTSSVLLVFNEHANGSRKYETLMTLATEFISKTIDDETNILALSMSSYVLALNNDPAQTTGRKKLKTLSKSRENYNWWTMNSDQRNLWKNQPNSIDIEITSYALLALIESGGNFEESESVFKWLVTQQNKFGGFTAVQDTIIGLFALDKYVSGSRTSKDISITFRINGSDNEVISVNDGNSLVFQNKQLSGYKPSDIVNVQAQGSGMAIVQVSFVYSTNVTGAWPLFILEPQVNKISTEFYLRLSLCLSYSNSNLTFYNHSNLVLMEVNLPTGFVVDLNSIPGLKVSRKVCEVKVHNKKSTVLLFYNNVTVEDLCTTITAHRVHDVKNLKPASVVVYDVYNNAIKSRMFYENRNLDFYETRAIVEELPNNFTERSRRFGNGNLQRQVTSSTVSESFDFKFIHFLYVSIGFQIVSTFAVSF